MTSEQIKIVNNIKFSIINAIDNIDSEQMWEMLKQAYEQTEKEPCDDCISREDAKNLFLDGTEGYDCRGFTRMEIGEMLDNLPSVTSTITDVENNYDIGYNCGYADAMFDIAEGSEDE